MTDSAIKNAFYLYNDVDSDTCLEFTTQLHEWVVHQRDSDDKKPFYLFIHSEGGDLASALSMYSSIQMAECEVITVACGIAASSAFLLLISGHKRYAMEYSLLNMHPMIASIPHESLINDMQKTIKMMDGVGRNTYDILDRHSNKARGWWKKKLRSGEYYPSLKQALELGVIDEILESTQDLNLVLRPPSY